MLGLEGRGGPANNSREACEAAIIGGGTTNGKPSMSPTAAAQRLQQGDKPPFLVPVPCIASGRGESRVAAWGAGASGEAPHENDGRDANDGIRAPARLWERAKNKYNM